MPHPPRPFSSDSSSPVDVPSRDRSARGTDLLDTTYGPIAFDVRGAGEKTIVLLPSGAHDRHDFGELRAILTPNFRTISLDWPAHGESPRGDTPASAMRFADIAEELIEQLAPDGAIVLGNSVGGFAAARLAIRRPELVKGLVVVDGGGFAGRPPHVHAFCALMARPRFLRAIYPLFSALYMRARTPADVRARATAIATTRSDPGRRAVSELWRSFASPEHDLRSEADQIDAPTLLIWGRRDPVIPVRFGKRAERLITDARLVVLDTGHVPHTSEPERVAAELTSFAEALFAELDSAHAAA
ncbi:MAG TPA: alpha/beta hydrolase [Solirubrobacteraceae bacterium]|jgi:pimeloyl-ACP methyl ester carboxylesterase|nr:alpha/beta hydrolase [Solirubrobacteraceae bacterium]